jgi:hypothetical protein
MVPSLCRDERALLSGQTGRQVPNEGQYPGPPGWGCVDHLPTYKNKKLNIHMLHRWNENVKSQQASMYHGVTTISTDSHGLVVFRDNLRFLVVSMLVKYWVKIKYLMPKFHRVCVDMTEFRTKHTVLIICYMNMYSTTHFGFAETRIMWIMNDTEEFAKIATIYNS